MRKTMKRILALLGCLTVILVLTATGIGESLFAKDLTVATDEELAEAAELIKAEQKSRLKTCIRLDQESLTIAKGQRQKITATVEALEDGVKAGKYVWESSDNSVVTCKGGNVQGAGSGTATITCSMVLSDGTELDAECRVTVFTPVSRIVPSQKSVTITAGQSEKLSASVEPANAEYKALTWESSKPEIVKVEGNGQITAVQEGKAQITVKATDGSGKSAAISVTVKPKGIVGKWINNGDSNNILEFKTDGSMTSTYYDNNDSKTVTIRSAFTYKANGNNITVTSISMTIYNNGVPSTLYSEYTSKGTLSGDSFTWKTLNTTDVYSRLE